MRLAEDALEFLAEVSDGDARRALSALEVGVLSSDERPLVFTRALAEESVQRKAIEYDATGDAHYDAASALIKSIRGSDPDAALYWLARMLEAGEDVRFLARRIVISASEDIVSMISRSTPPSRSASTCSRNASRTLSAEVVPIGSTRRPVGPIEPATKTDWPDTSRASRASLAPRRLISRTLSARLCSPNR